MTSTPRAWHGAVQKKDSCDCANPRATVEPALFCAPAAVALARPVVATAHPGTDLAMVVQTCGLVVPPEDAAALARAIQTLAADPALCESLGAAGYLYAHADKEGWIAASLSLLAMTGGIRHCERSAAIYVAQLFQ